MLRNLALASLLLGTACGDKTSARNVAMLQGHILDELTNAEHMIRSKLRGNPKIMDEELKLLKGAEGAARKNEEIEAKKPKGAQLLQQGTSEGLQKDANLLGMARTQVEQLLRGHPVELQKEEQALNEAMSAARSLSKPAAALMETAVHQKSAAKMETSVASLERMRSSSMAAALQEKRSFAAAEDKLVAEGGHIMSQLTGVKDAIAQAFAGKDSKGVKAAMAAGEMVDEAFKKQEEVTKMNRAEAVKTKKEVATEQAAFAQVSAQSKAVQEERAYTSGMARLASDSKAILGEFADLKSAVANAYAGKNSKAVQDAMEVGELLDQAREQQQDVAKRDEAEATSAKKLFQNLRSRSSQTTLIQKEGAGQVASARATQAMRLQRLAASERKTLRETKDAEDKVKKLLRASHDAKAAAVQDEVVAALEKAERSEESALDATGKVRRH